MCVCVYVHTCISVNGYACMLHIHGQVNSKEKVTVQPTERHTATVIWLHGLDDKGAF